MKTLESIALPESIERRVHELQLEQGLAGDVIAGGAVDADPSDIDRRCLCCLREIVGHLRKIVGIDVLGPRRVVPGTADDTAGAVVTGDIERPVGIAVPEYDGA